MEYFNRISVRLSETCYRERFFCHVRFTIFCSAALGIIQRELFYSGLETICVIIRLSSRYCFPIVDFDRKTFPLWKTVSQGIWWDRYIHMNIVRSGQYQELFHLKLHGYCGLIFLSYFKDIRTKPVIKWKFIICDNVICSIKSAVASVQLTIRWQWMDLCQYKTVNAFQEQCNHSVCYHGFLSRVNPGDFKQCIFEWQNTRTVLQWPRVWQGHRGFDLCHDSIVQNNNDNTCIVSVRN